jgi:predicted TIM-barrel fold metal-dependent hydrolase
MMIIDAHAHFINRIDGRKGNEKTSAGSYGKVWVGDTEKQMLPPCLADSVFPDGMLVATLDAHGIDRAVLLQNPFYGIMNNEIAQVLEKYPGRFKGTIQVDPHDGKALETIRRFHSAGQSVLKFEMSDGWGWTGIYNDLFLDRQPFTGFWELAEELGMQVIIDPGPVDNPGYQPEELNRVTGRFPGVKFLIEHLAYMTADLYGDPEAMDKWKVMVQLGRKENVFIGFSAVYSLMEEAYPCPRSLKLLREVVDQTGGEKVLWGTDIPTTMGRYTYRQMMDLILEHTGFLDDKDRANIMGMNAARFFDWK